jgi:hypothetical protein
MIDGKVFHSSAIVDEVEHIYYVDDMVYYFVHSLFILMFVIITFLKIERKNKASKVIMLGVVFWFQVEFIEIFCQLAKINDSRLFINNGSWIQLSTSIAIALLALFGYTKFKS